ncbi:response regulator transcription factor [Hymenobacter busanensis]|uniref:Response regulator transcription factor n=1 Tax=Hymenobacter busanensis TaxID=2607656 RepID=A0A7L4ZWK1_9BACT|nr:LytTR family DNA-binding domain-containing protein [Hymenobacter busanensis]KAA9332437.1 response regulator transcription factor [Hymenobacter busanensis]QHJ07225.1 response regulator [Hymenobacter busanensis]
MRLLILEDEAPTARQIRLFAARYGLPTHDVHEARSVEKALAWFGQHEMPALVFSDIELLDGNVFGLYQQVRVTCPIIFTTAYDQFLLPAFQANGIGYLLKPFNYAQFAAALAKYDALKASFAPPAAAEPEPAPAEPVLSAAVIEQLSAALRRPAQGYRQRLTVRQPNNSFYLLPVEEVAYLQADEGVVFAVDQQGGRHPITGTLTEWEQQLDPAQFCRLNRGELLHLPAIDKIEPYFNNRLAVRLRHGATLTSSAAQTPALRRWLEG